MQEPKQIVIEAGVTDLSTIPTDALAVMIVMLKDSLNEMGSQAEEMAKAAEAMIAERERMKAELKKRQAKNLTPVEKVELLVKEHFQDFGPTHEMGSLKEVKVEEIDCEIYITIPLPTCNHYWTFRAWEWAKSFCEKNKGFYPEHLRWMDPKTLYIRLGSKARLL